MTDDVHLGYVYKITNTVNGKTYVGKHKLKSNEKWLDYLGSGKLISRAVQKYGKASFIKELIRYADTEADLSQFEIEEIQKEISIGKSEYNLHFGDPNEIQWSSIFDLDKFPILNWYFDEGLSTREIAVKVGCSQPTIITYFDKFRDSDDRFSKVKERSALISKRRSDATIKRLRMSRVPYEKVQCSICSELFGSNTIKNHVVVCTKRLEITPNICMVCNVVISAQAKHCTKHYKIESKPYDRELHGEIRSKGSIAAAHTRWHVKREIINEDCALCVTS